MTQIIVETQALSEKGYKPSTLVLNIVAGQVQRLKVLPCVPQYFTKCKCFARYCNQTCWCKTVDSNGKGTYYAAMHKQLLVASHIFAQKKTKWKKHIQKWLELLAHSSVPKPCSRHTSIHGCMHPRIHGSMHPWIHGAMHAWMSTLTFQIRHGGSFAGTLY